MKTCWTAIFSILIMVIAAVAAAAPIHEAAWNGDLARATQILGQDPSSLSSWDDVQGRTPLHIAVQRDNIELAQLLIARGADVNAAGVPNGNISYTGIGVTPLHLAAGKGSVAMIKLLLDHGADANARSLPSWVRAQSESVSDIEVLAEIQNGIRVHGKTPLHFAAMKGQVPAAQMLIQRGAKIDLADELGQAPLHLAAYCNRPQFVTWLLDNGADLNARARDGWTALHYAAAGADERMVSLLLDRGAASDESNCAAAGPCTKITPLHLAALRGNRSIAAVLLKHGANPNAQTPSGSTPLDLAQQKNKTDLVSLLTQAPSQ